MKIPTKWKMLKGWILMIHSNLDFEAENWKSLFVRLSSRIFLMDQPNLMKVGHSGIKWVDARRSPRVKIGGFRENEYNLSQIENTNRIFTWSHSSIRCDQLVRFQFFRFDLEMMQKYGFVQVTFKDTDFLQLKNSWNCEKILVLLWVSIQ